VEEVMVEIVSSQTDEQRKIAHAASRIEWTLRKMLANLLRVQRGAGKDYEIFHQIVDCANAFIEYGNLGGERWNLDMHAMLDVDRYQPGERKWGDALAEVMAMDEILHGAMQTIASRLLEQRTQQSAGESEMHSGMRRYREALAERDRKWRMTPRHEVEEELKALLPSKGKPRAARENDRRKG
jgi:hypothetical protein